MCEHDRPRERDFPAYDLNDVKRAFQEGRFRVTGRVARYMMLSGLDAHNLRGCVLGMASGSFCKSQADLTGSGCWLDVYRPYWGGQRWYVKLVQDDQGGEYRVLSFCKDGNRH